MGRAEAAAAGRGSPWEHLSREHADVRLLAGFLEERQADRCLRELTAEVAWQNEEVVLFGRRHPVPRLICWQGDPGAIYTYSGVRHEPAPWSPTVVEIRQRLMRVLPRAEFNSVLLNLYRDGNDSMGWHADDEHELGDEPTIASLSLGAERDFQMRRRVGDGWERHDLLLPHGSLLVMAGQTQRHWQHRLPKRKAVDRPRINLTFRNVVLEGQARG